MVDRSKRKNGSKRSPGKMMEDVSHRLTMPLAAGKKPAVYSDLRTAMVGQVIKHVGN